MSGCCRGLSAKVCIARPYGCSDEPPKTFKQRLAATPAARLTKARIIGLNRKPAKKVKKKIGRLSKRDQNAILRQIMQ